MLTNTKNPGQRVHFIGNRQRTGNRAGRQIVPCETRLVLLVQRHRNIFGFAVMTRIVHAHHALRVGELKHHIGHQVAFGQQARARGVIHISTNLRCDPTGKGLNTIGFVTQRTQLFLEQHGFEARQVIFKALFAVGIKKEFGIRQTRAYNLLITGNDLLRIAGLNVGHKNEVW
ncbi:hypothetical protein PAJ_3263 [Pantoea ananatis AJ13355]|uniref:Uncharacterized protein n=1 Tax=Pantoea ananatis (strain AJ13355) TaxID=932677 RepID=A0A0H3L5Z7_PANAA|nr:hypothetical protein PAJ_3263 [Pantoea ananatis AJ13355]